jgi:hypothetical protein
MIIARYETMASNYRAIDAQSSATMLRDRGYFGVAEASRKNSRKPFAHYLK